MDTETTPHDWHFDVGSDGHGHLLVEASASAMPDRRMALLTRTQLVELRQSINRALRLYQPPAGEAAGPSSRR